MFVPWGALLYTGRAMAPARHSMHKPDVAAPPRDLAAILRRTGHLALFGVVLVLVLYGRPVHGGIALPGTATSGAPARWRSAGLWGSHEAREGYLPPGAAFSTHRMVREVPPAPDLRPTGRTVPITYTVVAGDTLQSIAERFGLEPRTVVWANDDLAASPSALHPGQELRILPVDGVYHVVAPGETVAGIAAKYGVEPALLRDFPGNDLREGADPAAGQGLVIPGAQARSSSAAGYASGAGSLPFLPGAELPEGAAGGTGSLAWPLVGLLSQGFWAGHPAIDIAAPGGTPILAADAGVVGLAGTYHPQYGVFVVLNHGDGLQTLYAHLESACVETGMAVERGQVIGGCGCTGNCTGSHLHLEVYQNGQRQNPLLYLPPR